MSTRHSNDIAIIGISAKFPGAKNYHEFWSNLQNKKVSVEDLFKKRWFKIYNEESLVEGAQNWLKYGSLIENPYCFDNEFFNTPEQDAIYIDPQQRLLLELTWHCLEDAGIKPKLVCDQPIGVFIGACNFDYKEILETKDDSAKTKIALGTSQTYLANRISHFLNIHGPSITIDTACSSSLVAVHYACDALKAKQCKAAIVGGVNIISSINRHKAFGELGVLSQKGICSPFDDAADGYIRGEGAALLMLKPLDQALLDKNKIHAVIKGSGTNHSGQSKTLTSSNAQAIEQLMKETLKVSSLTSKSIQFLEAHGTGTKLGDPLELLAISKVFGKTKKGPIHISSVKANIGHLEPASGIAGLIKTILCMKNCLIPGMPNYKSLNHHAEKYKESFKINTENAKWKTDQTDGNQNLRRAGVTSLGIGGVNAHVIIEEYIGTPNSSKNSVKHDEKLPILISAQTTESLLNLLKEYQLFTEKMLNSNSNLQVNYLAKSILQTREIMRFKWVAFPNNLSELNGLISSFLTENETNGIITNLDKAFSLDKLSQHYNKQQKLYCEDIFKNDGEHLVSLVMDQSLKQLPLPSYCFDSCEHLFTIDSKPGVSKVTSESNIKVSASSVSDFLMQKLNKILNTSFDKRHISSSLVELGMDSISFADLLSAIEAKYGLSINVDEFYSNLNSIDKIIKYIIEKSSSKENVLLHQNKSSPQCQNIEERPEENIASFGTPKASQEEYDNSELIHTYTKKTKKSQNVTQKLRTQLADIRAVTGFNFLQKQSQYPLTFTKAQGSKVIDLDSNEYVDITMGMGVHLFGHSPKFITSALETQLHSMHSLGGRPSLLSEAVKKFCKLTQHERVSFFNTGTEAVTTAIRAARAYTGKNKIIMFEGSYHGHADDTLMKLGNSGEVTPRSIGIPVSKADNIVLFSYGDESIFEYIRKHENEIACILIEPIQSRNPTTVLKSYLKKLREDTLKRNIIYIFDEMITGFRLNSRGASEYFDITPDIATYGKIIGGGLPIGLVAGRKEYLDIIDGGYWDYNDKSYPSPNIIFSGGTFFQHPLTLAAMNAVLNELEAQGPTLQTKLNSRTDSMVQELNQIASTYKSPIQVESCGSLFRFKVPPYLDSFYTSMRLEGVYTLKQYNCFMSTAHSEDDIKHIVRCFEKSVAQGESTATSNQNKSLFSNANKYVKVAFKNKEAKQQLILFPPAGARSHIFDTWVAALKDKFEILIIEYPRKNVDGSLSEIDCETLLRNIEAELESVINRPNIVLGHSLGAMLAYCTVLKIEQNCKIVEKPNELIILGEPSPHNVQKKCESFSYLNSYEKLNDLIIKNNLLPKNALSNKAFMEYAVPLFKQDLEYYKSCNLKKSDVISCSIHGYFGDKDYTVSPSDIEKWASATTNTFVYTVLNSDHNLIQNGNPILENLFDKCA